MGPFPRDWSRSETVRCGRAELAFSGFRADRKNRKDDDVRSIREDVLGINSKYRLVFQAECSAQEMNSELDAIAPKGFGDMVKAVVDVSRGLMPVGGDLHSDAEALLIDDGSRHGDRWGINL